MSMRNQAERRGPDVGISRRQLLRSMQRVPEAEEAQVDE